VKVTGYPERAPHRPAAPPARSDDRRAHLRVITGDAVDRPSHEPVRPHNSARGRTSQEPLGPRNDARGGRSHGPVGSHRAVQRRTSHQPLGRLLAHPDRIALWAVLLGFFLIVVALSSASSDAATHPARSAGAVHSSR
jgi:hypothetical protein